MRLRSYMKKLMKMSGLALCILALFAQSAYAAVDLPRVVQSNPADYTPNVKGKSIAGDTTGEGRTVNEITRIGSYTYAAGTITDVGQTAAPTTTAIYSNAFRFNATTGVIDKTGFTPQFAGKDGTPKSAEIFALEPSADGQFLYIGGRFSSVNGVSRLGIVKWNLATNQPDPTFNPVLNRTNFVTATVYDIKLFNNRLYVASDATMIGASKVAGSGSQLMTLDQTTGARTSYINLAITTPILDPALTTYNSGAVRVEKIAISPALNRLVMIGNFRSVAGAERLQLAMLELGATSGTLSGWYAKYHMGSSTLLPNAKEPTGTTLACARNMAACMRDVDWNPAGTSFVLCGTGGGRVFPSLSDTVSYWSGAGTGTDNRPAWINYTGSDTFLSCRATAKTVYVGGHFNYLDYRVYRNGVKVVEALGTRPHHGLGAIDTTTGVAVPGFNPSTTTGRGFGWAGMHVDPATGGGLWVGGDAEGIMGEPRQRLGLFPL